MNTPDPSLLDFWGLTADSRPLSAVSSEHRGDRFHRLLGRDHGNDLELDQVLPLEHPPLEQPRVVTF